MNIYLEQIIELSHIDNDINSFEPRIEEIKRNYNSIAAEREEISLQIEKIRDSIRDVSEKIEVIEEDIERISKEQKDYEKKIKTVTKEKELNALNMENDIRREQIQYDNSEIDRYGNIKEKLEVNLKEKKEELLTFEKRLSAEEEAMKERLDSLSETRKTVLQKRELMVGEMDQKIYSFYGKIRRWAKESSVVPVRDGACYGCFIKLSDQTHLEVIKGEEIITCPNCGRVLYLERDDEEAGE
jgi:predicted  nucleic acid-binding Zn-ribbon protein